MRKTMYGALAVAVAGTLVVPGSASAVDQVNTTKLRKAVTVNQILQHERQLQVIANRHGGTRASGTPGYDASAAYVAETLRTSGYAVRTQTFTFPFFRAITPAEVSEISPTARDFSTATFTYSGSGDVTGQVVPTTDVQVPPGPTAGSSTSGCEASDFIPAPAGPAVALVQRGTCTFEDKTRNAVAAGYDAVIVFNEGQPGREEVLDGTLGAPVGVPVVGLSYADGAALYADARAGATTVRVATSTETDLDRTTTNVIADSSAGATGQTVVVGAHLDSVTEGAGINDNGSGSATVLEIAQQMAELGYTGKLQRRVRFAFWGAEELGLLGSQHYVDSLSDTARASIYANLNFDMVGSPNYVRFVYDGDGSDTPDAGPTGSDAIEAIFTDYFDRQGLASEPTAFDGRSDYGPFVAAGIPAGGLFSGAEGAKTAAQAATYGGTAGEAYDACYHKACDDTTNLNAQALGELGDAAAHATLTLAKSRSGLYPDGSRRATTAPVAPTGQGHAPIR